MHRIKILFQNIFTVQFKRQKQILKGFGHYKHDILDVDNGGYKVQPVPKVNSLLIDNII